MSKDNIQAKPYDFRETGTIQGMVYAIIQHESMGHLCGYVRIPTEHPAHAHVAAGDYEAVEVGDLDVHGGITFAGGLDHKALEGKWIGFDCAHLFDLVPSMDGHPHDGSVFRTPEFVRKEIESLITQIHQVTQ